MAKKVVIIVCLAFAIILLFHKAEADSLKTEPPKKFVLSKNVPIPVIPDKPIKWTVPDSCYVEIIFLNVMGDIVDTLINEFQTEGFYEEEWEPAIKAMGIYLCRMVICEDTIFKKYIYWGSDTQSDTAKALNKSDSLQSQTPQNKQEGE